MKKYFVLMMAVGLISSSAFAKGGYEVCKGVSRDGDAITIVGDYDTEANAYTVEVNAQGQRLTYTNCDPVDAGDVADGYNCHENGGLKVTFYDEDMSASGYSQNLGAFKLSCQDVQ